MNDQSTEHVISMLRACVLSTKNDISLKMLKTDYSRLVGSDIPYQKLGFKSLEAFLESIPDLKMNRGPEGYLTISAAPTERSQHIADLVSRQKSPIKKISPIKYTSTQRRSAASWTAPYKSSHYEPKEGFDGERPYSEFKYKGRDSFRSQGSYKGLSDRYNPKGKDYYRGHRDTSSSDLGSGSGSDDYYSKKYTKYKLRAPDRYNARNYHKTRLAEPQPNSSDTSIAEDWDELSEESDSPQPKSKAKTPQPNEKPPNEGVTSPICEANKTISPDSASVVGRSAKPVEIQAKANEGKTVLGQSQRGRPTPAQLRLNAQRKAALQKQSWLKKSEEEDAETSKCLANLMETLSSLSVNGNQVIPMDECKPLNVTYYVRLMTDHITENALPKAEVVVTSRWIGNSRVHSCEIKLGVLAVTSFPFEDMDSNVVVDYASREMLRAFNQVRLPIEVHHSDPIEVLNRILRMIFLHPRGIWNTSLPRLYFVAFKDRIPSNWMELVQSIPKHQVQIVKSQNEGVFILKPNLVGLNILFNEPSAPPTEQKDLPSSVTQNAAVSILMQDLSYHSMGLPVAPAQTFMPISNNIRPNPRMRTPMFNQNPLTFGPMAGQGIRPRLARGRGIHNTNPIYDTPMLTEKFLLPMSQEPCSIAGLPTSEELGFNLTETRANCPVPPKLFYGSQPNTSPALRSPEMSPQLNAALSGSESASSATMSLPTLSPDPASPELVSELVLENISAHDMAATGINEKLKLPKDDAWDVQVTTANSIQEVWVRIIGDFHSVPYNNMAADMEIHYMNLNDDPLIPVEPKVGSYYAIQLESCWHRVKLVELSEAESEGVTLFFIDQGDEEKYPFSMCHYLDPLFMTLPGQAVQCHLAFMEMFRKDPAITEHLIDMLLGKYFVANVLSLQNSKAYIVLYNTENNADINVNNLIVEKLAASLKPTDMNEVGSVKEVLLSHISRDGTVYIQLLDTAFYCIQYMTYQLTNYPMKKTPKSANPFRNGEVYLARYNLEEDLLRVVLQSKPDDDQQVLVQYIDYGFKEMIPVKLLIRPTDFADAIQDIAPLARNVKLSNLPSYRFTKQMAARLRSLVPNSVSALAKILKRPDEDLAEVELFKRIQPDNLLVSVNNTLLLDPHLATPVAEEEEVESEPAAEELTTEQKEGSNTDTPVQEAPPVMDEKALKRLESIKQSFKPSASPNIGEEFDVHVAMASNPSNFTVQPWSQNQELDDMMQEMQKVYNEQAHDELTVDDIIPGGVYAALNNTDMHWYRATVSRKMGTFDKAAIFVCFTDFGDFNLVPIESIKLLDPRFLELPVQAIKAKLSDVGPVHADWSVEGCLFFQELVNQREFVSIVKENGPDVLNPAHTVIGLRLIDTSSDTDVYIDKLLVEKGHAIYIDKPKK